MLRRTAKRVLSALGLQRIPRNGSGYPKFPAWMLNDTLIDAEESQHREDIDVANRHYRPAQLRYRRYDFGDDHRLKYFVWFLDIRGQRVMELGPYQAHHTIILDKMGAREIVAVESRPENVEWCESIKRKYKLASTTFALQDVERLYRREEAPKFAPGFDVVFCSGFLYHIPEPEECLKWMRSQGKTLFLATHYVEPQEPQRYEPGLFTAGLLANRYKGFWYGEGGHSDPRSGMSGRSFWPYAEDLVAMLKDAGYESVNVLGKDLQGAYPCITILAE